MNQVVCVDLDGCICNDSHRHHLAPASGRALSEWATYHMACGGDKPIEGTIKTVQALAKLYRIHIITGRQEIAREITVSWLSKHEVPYDELRMYQEEDLQFRKWRYKTRYLEELKARGFEPVLFIEDWPLTAGYIEKEGVPVLCINSRFPKLYDRKAKSSLTL